MAYPILEKVTITDLATQGKSLARHEGKVIFVPLAVPGDIADIQLVKSKAKYAEGKIVRFHQLSPYRQQPFCEHFGVCGGCQWQHLDYAEQLKYKQKEVLDTLAHLGKLQVPTALPIIGGEETRFYRNKLEFTFSNNRWLTTEEIATKKPVDNKNALGFHIPGSFSKVLDIHQCHLQNDRSNQIRLTVKNYALENQLSFFDIARQQGLLRNLIIRNSTLGEWMVIISFGYEDAHIKKLLDFLLEQFTWITSLHYVINPKRNDTIFDLEIHTYHGRGFIFEELTKSHSRQPLRFKIGPLSFFQTNTRQAEKLYEVIARFAGLKGDETIYDLYTGTGSIAIYLAAQCKQVIGIEQIVPAIEDARFNAGLNEVENTQFFAGDIKETLDEQFIHTYGRPQLIVTDPPRAGMHPEVVKELLAIESPAIIYVSCNPASQARDLQLLSTKYHLEMMQAVDMFPHTHHIENVALLKIL